jgi:hypothetical protein
MLPCLHWFDVNGVEYLCAPTEALIITHLKFDGVVDSDMLEGQVPIVDRVLELTL